MDGDGETTPVDINRPSPRDAQKRRWKQQKTSIATRMKMVTTWEEVTMEGNIGARRKRSKKTVEDRQRLPPIQTTNRLPPVDYQPQPPIRSEPKRTTLPLIEQIKERYSDTRRASLLIYSPRDSLRHSLFAFRRSWPTQNGDIQPEVTIENPRSLQSRKPVLGDIERHPRTVPEQSRRDSHIPDSDETDERGISQPTIRRVSFATELPHLEPARTRHFELGRRRSIRLPNITEKQSSDSAPATNSDVDDVPIGISFKCSDEFRSVFNEMFGQMSVE